MRNKKLTLKESWVWEEPVTKKVQELIKGRSLNICCGMNKIGDVLVDMDPKTDEVIKADMNKLPFKDNEFDTVISDPPWKINYFHRMKPFFECVRVCKVGGRIIYNATWLPESKVIKLQKIFVRQSARFGNVSVIAIFKKIKDVSEIEKEKCQKE